MVQTLAEYANSLNRRADLIWPKVLPPKPVKAVPSIKPLHGIKAVLWDIYGTLLRTPDGGFTLFPEPELRLQVALEKTIHEFNMWNSMYRKPGPPWESMIHQYRDYAERLSMVATKRRGDFTEVNSVGIWRTVVDRLFDKDYHYEEATLGNPDELSEKIAYFFHRTLQATEARPGTVESLTQLRDLDIRQALLADAQPFTLLELTQDLNDQGLQDPIHQLLSPDVNVLSYQFAVRKPSKTLFEQALVRLAEKEISPEETLHVSCRLETDLMPARALGMKTALLACEKTGLEAPSKFIKDPQTRPHRLMTDITQITSIVPGS